LLYQFQLVRTPDVVLIAQGNHVAGTQADRSFEVLYRPGVLVGKVERDRD
jgi:hypothetical protein